MYIHICIYLVSTEIKLEIDNESACSEVIIMKSSHSNMVNVIINYVNNNYSKIIIQRKRVLKIMLIHW